MDATDDGKASTHLIMQAWAANSFTWATQLFSSAKIGRAYILRLFGTASEHYSCQSNVTLNKNRGAAFTDSIPVARIKFVL